MTRLSPYVSLSGGKDSTAMLLMMLERGEHIEDIVFFDTGWEFPQMIEHINDLERHIGRPITRLKPKMPFGYWMFQRPIKANKGPLKGQIHRYGYGWPAMTRRWCTRLKTRALDAYVNGQSFKTGVGEPLSCVGYASDEAQRIPDKTEKIKQRYPLVEYGVTEAQALQYCYDKGFDWGGLYTVFSRVSCYCCPLQGIGELRKLRRHFPGLWEKILEMDRKVPGHNRGFVKYKTAHDLEERFQKEEQDGCREAA